MDKLNGWMDEWMDEWMDKWMDESDGWMNGWIKKSYLCESHLVALDTISRHCLEISRLPRWF